MPEIRNCFVLRRAHYNRSQAVDSAALKFDVLKVVILECRDYRFGRNDVRLIDGDIEGSFLHTRQPGSFDNEINYVP